MTTPTQTPDTSAPTEPSQRRFNEMSILAPLLGIYTSACLALMVADFWLGDKLDVHHSITPIYIALLVAYAADKEIRRWVGRPEPPRKGSVFVYLWALLYLIFFIIHTFNPNYKMPEEIGSITLEVIGIFFGTKASKHIHQARAKRSDDKAKSMDYREFVLTHLQTHGRINRSDVMQQFNISASTATRILADIAKEGLIIPKGAGRDSHFVLPPPT